MLRRVLSSLLFLSVILLFSAALAEEDEGCPCLSNPGMMQPVGGQQPTATEPGKEPDLVCPLCDNRIEGRTLPPTATIYPDGTGLESQEAPPANPQPQEPPVVEQPVLPPDEPEPPAPPADSPAAPVVPPVPQPAPSVEIQAPVIEVPPVPQTPVYVPETVAAPNPPVPPSQEAESAGDRIREIMDGIHSSALSGPQTPVGPVGPTERTERTERKEQAGPRGGRAVVVSKTCVPLARAEEQELVIERGFSPVYPFRRIRMHPTPTDLPLAGVRIWPEPETESASPLHSWFQSGD